MAVMLPKRKGLRRESNATGQPSTTYGTALTSHTVANTLPTTFTQLIASTAFDTDWVEVYFHSNNTAATDSDSLVNIYVGAAAAEQVLIPNLLAGWAPNPITNGRMKAYGFPLYIPAGTRISAKHQSVRTSTSVICIIVLYGSDRSAHWTGSKVEAIGVDTANSSGTYITPGTASEGTLTRLGASDGAATLSGEWGYTMPFLGGNTDTTLGAAMWVSIDLGTSAAAISGLDEFWFYGQTDETTNGLNGMMGRYCYVPAGTILYARSQASVAPEAMAVCAYGAF